MSSIPHAFLDSFPDMIFMLGLGGAVKEANGAADERLFGGVSGGVEFSSFLDQEGQNRLARMLARAAQKKTQEEFYFFPLRGAPLHLDVIAFPYPEEGSEDALVCCVARDMTERLKMESELLEAERLVVMGQMAAGIAHEVNNPLNIISNNAELMRELTGDAELLRCTQVILHNVDRAAATIKQLLELSVPARLELADLDLSEILRGCLDFLRPRLKEVRLDLSGLPASLPLRGDKTQLEQLVLNLLLNALSSMEDSGTISVKGCTDSVEKNAVRLEIHDSGKGVARENLERIFDLFFTTRNREGFGVGLFLCRRIAERHSGLLFAESEEGRGASLILEMPSEKKNIL